MKTPKYNSHYDWLKEHLNDFWVKVFDKTLEETCCAGIIGAHGDKGYCFKWDWEQEGIPFPHAMALYLLTYTEVMDRPKWESREWVIENYPKYKEFLPPINEEEWE